MDRSPRAPVAALRFPSSGEVANPAKLKRNSPLYITRTLNRCWQAGCGFLAASRAPGCSAHAERSSSSLRSVVLQFHGRAAAPMLAKRPRGSGSSALDDAAPSSTTTSTSPRSPRFEGVRFSVESSKLREATGAPPLLSRQLRARAHVHVHASRLPPSSSPASRARAAAIADALAASPPALQDLDLRIAAAPATATARPAAASSPFEVFICVDVFSKTALAL
eukprot:tig00021179_g19259.t1